LWGGRQWKRGSSWVCDISGELSVDAVVQFFKLWEAIVAIPHNAYNDDGFTWKWMADGSFSSKMAYHAFFHGSTVLPGASKVWHSFAPYKFKFHAWFSLRGRCWIADRHLHRSLPSHTACPLCVAAYETINHLLLWCPFAIRIWTGINVCLGVSLAVPNNQSYIRELWSAMVAMLSKKDAWTANSLIMLALRSLWFERNGRVFKKLSVVGE
jgi:hypothetical protein